MRWRHLCAVAAATAALALGCGETPAQAAPQASGAVTDFASCLAGRQTGDLLLLIDESGSLQSTDPRAARVTAAQYMINALAPELVRAHVKLSVAVAGFASRYQPVSTWTTLDSRSARTVDSALNTLRNAHNGFETDYWSALDGARKVLEQRAATDSQRCQALIWFTDGQQSISARTDQKSRDEYGSTKPYSSNLKITSRTAAQQATADAQLDLCRKGGLADAIRADGIRTFAIGLQAGQQLNFGLLKAIATGTGMHCGAITNPSPGTFQTANDIDTLLFDFDRLLPGQPPIPLSGKVCQGSATNCPDGAQRFVLDDSIAAVHVLATSGVANAVVQLRGPAGRPVTMTRNGAGAPITVSNAQVSYRWQSKNTIQFDMTEPAHGSGWRGQWSLTFIDPASSSAGATAESDIHVSGDVVPAWPGARSTDVRAGSVVGGVHIELRRSNGTVVPASNLEGTATLSIDLVDSHGAELSRIASSVPKSGIDRPFSLDLRHVSPGPAALRMRLQITTAATRVGNRTVPGTALTPVSVDAPFDISAPRNYPVVPHAMSFGQLTGATHKTVALHVTGSGCVWLPASPGAHLLSAPDGIGTVSVSTHADSPSNCVKVNGSADLPLVISNQHQVNGSLRGDLVVGTSSSQPGGAIISDTVHFTASFQKQLDKFVWLLALALALVLGVGLPLLLMLAAKWWEAKIPGGTLVYERFAIDIAGNEARRDGIPVAYRDGDFVHTGVEVPRRGLRRVDLGSVTLRTRISAAPGARAYVEVDASGRLGASSELDRPYTKRLTGRLPLAVYNRWVVLWDPADRPDTAELLVLVHGTASSNDKRKLMADAATRAPQVFERLVLEARQAGVAAPAPQPATVGAAPWGSPGDAADTTPPWSSPAPNNTGVGAAGSQGTNRSPWDPGPGTGSPWDAPRGDAGGPGPGGNSPWDNPPR